LRGLRSWSNSSLDDLPPDIHHIIEVCDAIEKKFEETQQANSNPVFNREDSMAMDVDYNPASSSKADTQNNDCRICLEDLDASQFILPTCKHTFHRYCIEKWFQSSGKQTCPTCGYLYGITKGMIYRSRIMFFISCYKGPQPQGEMKIKYLPTPLPGFPPEQYAPNEGPTIEITYTIPSGVQGPLNPQPGQSFIGTVRTAYLPNNSEGKYVLNLLKRAFDDQHIFTIGKSSTTGRDNVVIWNDIHHKTQINGGPEQ
jgi:deltex-like protein